MMNTVAPFGLLLLLTKMALGALGNFLDEVGLMGPQRKAVLVLADIILSGTFVYLAALNAVALLGWESSGKSQDALLTIVLFASLAGGWEFMGGVFTNSVIPGVARAVQR